ncbi:PEGA domain-containing protein [Elusimicrobiota bacterium]
MTKNRKILLISILAVNTFALLASASLLLCTAFRHEQTQCVQTSKIRKKIVEYPRKRKVTATVDIPVKPSSPAPVLMHVRSQPADAKVFVNGYFKGRTPANVKIVSVTEKSKYSLVLLKEGFYRWEKNIEVDIGQQLAFEAVLEEKN